MAFEKGRKFSTGTSVHRKRQMSTLVEKEGHFGPALTVSRTPFPALSSLRLLYLVLSRANSNSSDALPRYLCRILG